MAIAAEYALFRGLTYAACIVAAALPAQTPRAERSMAEGEQQIVSHRAGEPVIYVFEAEQDRMYLVEVEQRGLDFVIEIEDPAGAARSYNSPLVRDEPEFILLETTTGGPYRFTVVSEEPTYAAGAHAIAIRSVNGGQDRSRHVQAWRLMSNAAAAYASGSGEQEAAEWYVQAADIWQELGDIRLQAQCLFSAARLRYLSLNDGETTAAQAAAAAELYLRTDARGVYANAVSLRARALAQAAEMAGESGEALFDDALAAFQESLAVHEALDNRPDLAVLQSLIGLAYFSRGNVEAGDYRQAEVHYRRAAELFSRLGEWREELNVRHNVAIINLDEGYAATAARELRRILDEIPTGQDPRFRGSVLANLGFAHLYAGDFDEALAALSDARSIFRSQPRSENWEGYALRGLGATYYALGELERAGEYLQQALEKASDGRVRASILAALGNAAFLGGEYAEALDLHERAVASTTSGSDRAYRQTLVARDLVALERFEEAVATAAEALAESGSNAVAQADSALELGYAYLGLGRTADAVAHFDRALAVYDSLGLLAEQAHSLRGRALAARAAGDLRAAIRWGEESLQRIDRLRTNVSAPELRAFYAARHRDYYDTQIDLLLAAHQENDAVDASLVASAFAVSERARARMTAELLAEASRGYHPAMSPSVRDRQRELYEELAALRYQRDRLLEKEAPGITSVSDRLARMAEVEHELSLLEVEIRGNDPRQANFAAPRPLTAGAVQALLDDRTVLLQFSLGKSASYAWVISSESVDIVQLADRRTIEAAARRAYENLRTPQRAVSDVSAAIAELSALVVAPVASLLNDSTRLIVASDAVLQYIPFGVLEVEGHGALVEKFEIINVPSISVWGARREHSAMDEPSRTLAVFADPVFTETDARFGESRSRSRLTQPLVDDRSSQAAAADLTRLPATAAEARAIAGLMPNESLFVATGFDASRELVLNMQLNDYRMIHFATHGLVDSRYPALSALALSQFDEARQPQDGFLRLHDIYAMNLNADLVVLSACETALGREIRGEGLIGLVQGFLYAGARNLVVSLWQVPDRAAAELMTRFYGHVLTDGLSTAEALRQAQLSIGRERRWSDPYFWGAFIVVGGDDDG